VVAPHRGEAFAASQFLIDSQSFTAQTAQAKMLNLKITGLKTFVVNVGSVNWAFCKVYTNQGLTGLGEGSITSKEATLTQAIMEHERFLIGKDPSDIELLWQGMFRYPRWRGGPILNSATAPWRLLCGTLSGKHWECRSTSCGAARRGSACKGCWWRDY
jgi:L-alanine-DL-glutamate epimerase-like enolase superfamily enzyme